MLENKEVFVKTLGEQSDVVLKVGWLSEGNVLCFGQEFRGQLHPQARSDSQCRQNGFGELMGTQLAEKGVLPRADVQARKTSERKVETI
jgi:hypothetical protein